MTKYEIIKKYIDEFDFLGLLEMGCPKDEFDLESKMLLRRISVNDSAEEIALKITRTMNSQFSYREKPELFMETAKKIKDAFITNKTTD